MKEIWDHHLTYVSRTMQNHHKDTPGKRRLKELEAAYANLKYWPKMKVPLNKWALSILVPWQGHPN